jgi:hypothetical protein
MLFYVVLGALFAIYALDLLLLVVVSLIARSQEEPLPVFDKDKVKKVRLRSSQEACALAGRNGLLACSTTHKRGGS